MTDMKKFLVFKKNICIYYFFRKKTSNTISKLSDHFFEDFFEVLHISVSPKINILESRSTFCDFFSKKTCSLKNGVSLRMELKNRGSLRTKVL